MIRVEGEVSGAHDPKLKLPLVASAGARAAAVATMSTGEAAALRKEIAALAARVAALEARGVAGSVTEPVTALPTVTASGNAPKLTAAEKQRAYRERQKAKA